MNPYKNNERGKKTHRRERGRESKWDRQREWKRDIAVNNHAKNVQIVLKSSQNKRYILKNQTTATKKPY